jgi:hypothetical protein
LWFDRYRPAAALGIKMKCRRNGPPAAKREQSGGQRQTRSLRTTTWPCTRCLTTFTKQWR